MGSKIEYVHSDQLLAANYVKNSKAIGFLWALFTVCYAIITLVTFIQPQWIGETSTGYLGLWRQCQVIPQEGTKTLTSDLKSTLLFGHSSTPTEMTCQGRLDDFSSIPNHVFKICTILMGISNVIASLTVFALIIFICAPARQAYFFIGTMQLLSALSTTMTVLLFPTTWSSGHVRQICGATADNYNLGTCSLRWAFVLAIIGLLDGLVLAILAFVLGSRQIKLTDEAEDGSSGSRKMLYPPHKGYMYENSTTAPSVSYSYASTKRSMNLHPVVLMPPANMHSSNGSNLKINERTAEYATPRQQFQL